MRLQLEALTEECVSLCEEEGWLGFETGRPNFRLLYSSVESFEYGSGFAIVGMNPAGGPRDADTGDADRHLHCTHTELLPNWGKRALLSPDGVAIGL